MFWIVYLTIPYFFLGLMYISFKLKKFSKYPVIFLIGFFLIFSVEKNLYYMYGFYGYPKINNEMNKWIKTNLKDKPEIIVDDWGWLGSFMLSQNKLGYEGEGMCMMDKEKVYLLPYYASYIPDRSKIIKFIEDKKPSYIIYAFRGKLPSVFNFSGNKLIEERLNYRFKRMAKDKYFAVYKILY
ncbi:hypothetical protein ACFLUV_04250 [Elusimicrobiota bacterium]